MKFSIVTPSYNSETYIAETVESVISQKGDFEIEYIIVDGASQDRTVEIIKEYEALLSQRLYPIKCRSVQIRWLSEKDAGMYDAINKGFEMATGDIYAYINTDDIYLPGAFEIVRRTFSKYQEIQWLKGITSYINELSLVYRQGRCFVYDQRWIQKGIYGRDIHFIQQDSVFWRSDLWKATDNIDMTLINAGDYSLWLKFSKITPLYSLNAPVSCFRHLDTQLTGDGTNYRREMKRLSPSLGWRSIFLKIFFSQKLRLPEWVRRSLYRIFFKHHRLRVVDLKNGGREPHLKTARYYIWRNLPARLIPK